MLGYPDVDLRALSLEKRNLFQPPNGVVNGPRVRTLAVLLLISTDKTST
jgi:hypothetical protein